MGGLEAWEVEKWREVVVLTWIAKPVIIAPVAVTVTNDARP